MSPASLTVPIRPSWPLAGIGCLAHCAAFCGLFILWQQADLSRLLLASMAVLMAALAGQWLGEQLQLARRAVVAIHIVPPLVGIRRRDGSETLLPLHAPLVVFRNLVIMSVGGERLILPRGCTSEAAFRRLKVLLRFADFQP